MYTNDLYEIKKDCIKKLSKISAQAFSDYITWKQIVPDKERRIKFLEILYFSLITYGIKYGKVYSTSENFEGFAIWINEKDSNLSLLKLIKSHALSLSTLKIFNVCSLKQMKRFTNLINQMNVSHNKFEYPNSSMYLLSIAVDEKHRNKGFASKLLKPMLKEFDITNKGCYLETGSTINIEIYKHFGFELLENLINTANNSNIYYMYRSPQ